MQRWISSSCGCGVSVKTTLSRSLRFGDRSTPVSVRYSTCDTYCSIASVWADRRHEPCEGPCLWSGVGLCTLLEVRRHSRLPCWLSLDSRVDMDEGCLYTLVENRSDTQFTIEYDDVTYSLTFTTPAVILRWNCVAPRHIGFPLVKFTGMTAAVQLDPIFANCDLRENVQITIVSDVTNTRFSCRMTPRTALNTLKRNCRLTFDSRSIWDVVKFYLRRMEDLQTKVRIWHNQCTYLFKKFQKGVERVKRADLAFQTAVDVDLEECYNDCYRKDQYSFKLIENGLGMALDDFIHCTLIRSMAEGEALLRSCGDLSYNRAALALSSLPPSVPTFSKFALATGELDWIVDFFCCDPEEKSRFDSWEWCEERCRLVSSNRTNRLDAMEDEILEADVRRQNADREALQASLDQKLSRSHGKSSFNLFQPITSWVRRTNMSNQVELEAIWRKRLQPSPCPPGSYSPLDAFVIDNPETSFVEHSVGSSRSGASKNVVKCKWLGETVALSTMSNVLKISAKAETGLLARVQHPSVVEWMGYAFMEDIRDRTRFRHCYLVTEHMESDLHDLITERLTNYDGTISTTRVPFDFLVAVDIALQVVEALIHVHKCRVLHRDIKPKNVLASPKYSHSDHCRTPIFYTIKLIDFGSSKIGEESSHFHTRKQGTTMYMAPEVWESEDSYSWSADVYSFGLTCYEIFHGRLPWESDMPLTFPNIQKVMRGKITFPFAYPEELEELIGKCCAQNPSDRPSFEVIRQALWRLKFLPLRDFSFYTMSLRLQQRR